MDSFLSLLPLLRLTLSMHANRTGFNCWVIFYSRVDFETLGIKRAHFTIIYIFAHNFSLILRGYSFSRYIANLIAFL